MADPVVALPEGMEFVGIYDPNDPSTDHLRPMPDPNNANMGTEMGYAAVGHSLEELGAGRSIVLDGHRLTPAGNKTLEQWVAGGGKVAIVKTRGDVLLAVMREDWDLLSADPNNPARRYAYQDNQTNVLDLRWDPEVIVADLRAGVKLDDHIFTRVELADFQARLGPDQPPAGGQAPPQPFSQPSAAVAFSQLGGGGLPSAAESADEGPEYAAVLFPSALCTRLEAALSRLSEQRGSRRAALEVLVSLVEQEVGDEATA